MSWKNIIKAATKEEVKAYAQEKADKLDKPMYFFQNMGRWVFDHEPPKSIKYEVINPTVKMDESRKFPEGFAEQEMMDISKKYSEDTLFMSFDNLEELVEAMLKNNTMNAKSLNVIYNKVKSGKINKDKQKEYLMNFKKYVSRKHGLRKQWADLVSAGKF